MTFNFLRTFYKKINQLKYLGVEVVDDIKLVKLIKSLL